MLEAQLGGSYHSRLFEVELYAGCAAGSLEEQEDMAEEVQIASDFGLNEYVSQIISGVILFFILGSEFFINYQVKAGGKHK